MARHELEISVPPKAILNTDVVITVVEDDEKLGELRISRGSIDWRPARAHGAYRLAWARFDRLMRDHGSRRA
jgi:hypothetical protein